MWDNPFLFLIVCGLAVWRLSNMVLFEEGPFWIFVYIRNLTGSILHDDDNVPVQYDVNFWGKLFSCIYCMSIWVAFFFCILAVISVEAAVIVGLPFSLSAIAVIVDDLSQK